MQNDNMKDSMLRLRKLREQLCNDQMEWEKAYEVRDFIVSHLQELHEMICDRKVKRQKIKDKSTFILEQFSALPDPCSTGEDDV